MCVQARAQMSSVCARDLRQQLGPPALAHALRKRIVELISVHVCSAYMQECDFGFGVVASF